jgi:alpha-tubulin suppressor-like RCC1 family protein
LGGEGLLGIGSSEASEKPIVVPGLPPIRSISCGSFHSVAIGRDGCVYSWGKGDNGRLGLGGNSSESRPMRISDFDGMQINSVSCGAEHTAAISADGKVFCWGKNRHGELGMESYNLHAQESSPTPVHDLLDETM